jgi:hypothetical protein
MTQYLLDSSDDEALTSLAYEPGEPGDELEDDEEDVDEADDDEDDDEADDDEEDDQEEDA